MSIVRKWWLPAVAVCVGLIIGYVDWHVDEVQVPILLIAGSSFIFSLFSGDKAWLWGLMIGCGVPISHIIGRAMGFQENYPVNPNIFVTFLAFIPAFVGAYCGVLLRKAFKGVES